MLRFLVALVLLAAHGSAARADTTVLHADLICDQKRSVAIVRFALSYNDDPPHYAELPATVDGRLSSLPGTDRTDCRLSHGPDIRIRSGEKQAFAHGAGGADPPAFFSLWINHRKVLSKFEWKPGYDDSFNNKPWLVALAIRPQNLTFCYRNENKEAIACKQQPLNLNKYVIDAEEYPANSNPFPPVGTVLIDPKSYDIPACQRYLDAIRKDSSDPSIYPPFQSHLSASITWQRRQDFHSLSLLDGKFTNMGDRQIVVISGDSHYFDGDIFVLVPRQVSVDDVAAFFGGEDIEQDIEKSPPEGWTVISGGRLGLYPDVSLRYVHLVPEEIGDELFFFAYPTNNEKQPSGILLKPSPSSGFDSLCIFQRVEPHY